MSRQATTWLARLLWALYPVLSLMSLLLQYLHGLAPLWLFAAIWLIVFPWTTVGVLVATHDPPNPIAWIFLVAPLLLAFGGLSTHYAIYALVTRPSLLPGGQWVAWVGAWVDDIGFSLLFTFMFLIFPTGRLLSRKWRAVAALAAAFVTLTTLKTAFAPGSIQLGVGLPSINNPVGIEAAAGVFELIERFQPLLGAAVIGSGVVSIVLRARRGTAQERQQIKWFAYAAGLFLGWVVLTTLNGLFGAPLSEPIVSAIFFVTITVLPIAIGIAILRYRLYDIDIIINRTLVYGLLTVMLAALYVMTVIVLQAIIRRFTGNTQSELVTVVSTLVIAALFQPLRQRIQALIDRRFYRRKYDAHKTLAAFSNRLRDEVELHALTDDVLAVIEETLQPTYVSLWLRESKRKL